MTFEEWWANEEQQVRPDTANGRLFDHSIALRGLVERAWERAQGELYRELFEARRQTEAAIAEWEMGRSKNFRTLP